MLASYQRFMATQRRYSRLVVCAGCGAMLGLYVEGEAPVSLACYACDDTNAPGEGPDALEMRDPNT